MSALDPKGIEALHFRLLNFFLNNMALVDLVVPYGKEGVLADIRQNILVLSESYEEKAFVSRQRRTPAPLPP